MSSGTAPPKTSSTSLSITPGTRDPATGRLRFSTSAQSRSSDRTSISRTLLSLLNSNRETITVADVVSGPEPPQQRSMTGFYRPWRECQSCTRATFEGMGERILLPCRIGGKLARPRGVRLSSSPVTPLQGTTRMPGKDRRRSIRCRPLRIKRLWSMCAGVNHMHGQYFGLTCGIYREYPRVISTVMNKYRSVTRQHIVRVQALDAQVVGHPLCGVRHHVRDIGRSALTVLERLPRLEIPRLRPPVLADLIELVMLSRLDRLRPRLRVDDQGSVKFRDCVEGWRSGR
ncbi:hypothetical protein Saa2_06452 [Streptomyces acidiscabies]|nr:hypothetical protein Saa2_06452 [Streptomyces acidiscabies]